VIAIIANFTQFVFHLSCVDHVDVLRETQATGTVLALLETYNREAIHPILGAIQANRIGIGLLTYFEPVMLTLCEIRVESVDECVLWEERVVW